MIEHWDYATLTGIARTILELRLAYFYLCAEELGFEEWDCRWNLFNLHDCTSRLRLFRAQGETLATIDEGQIIGFEEQATELRDRLRANSYFSSFTEKRQTELLKGGKAYLEALEEIAERAGFGRARYRYLNVLLSGHVHALPMSFYRLEDGRGQGLPNPVEENYTAMCFSLCATLMVQTRDEISALFEGLRA